jgi:uncharacterized membrane protein
MDSQNNQNGSQNQNNMGQGNQNNNQPQTPPNTNMVMSIFSYLGPLVIISYLTSKDNPSVKFHIKQGLAVFGLEVIVWILGSMSYSFWMIINILNLATLVLSILGIVNVVQGKEKELPIIGKFAQSFSI